MIVSMRAVWVSAIALVVCVAATADTLVTTDGKSYEGKLVMRTETHLFFQAYLDSGKKTTLKVPLEKVVSIKEGEVSEPAAKSKPKEPEIGDLPPAPEAPKAVKYDGATYYRIPLGGVVGKEFTASMLEKSLKDALTRKPDVVILEIDSPGGYIMEVEKIVSTIRDHYDKMRVVAWIKKEALSAAAISSLACKEIYMKSNAMIGAATAYRMTAIGLPADIGEKFQSVWRAQSRISAETGGHEPLLANAMIDKELELYIVEEDGKKVIREGTGAKMLTRKGRLLTMTASEALNCGLSAGTANDIEKLAEMLGLKKPEECKGWGTLLAEHRNKVVVKVEADMKKLHEEFSRHMERARENDPTRYTYTYWAHNRKFTPESKRKWTGRSAACSRFLAKAEEVLEVAAKLAGEFPFLMTDEDMLKSMRKAIKDVRERVARDAWKSSPDDIADR